MSRLIRAMDTTTFWIAVFVLSLLFVFAYAFVVNRDAVARNSTVITRLEQQLVQLCNTIRVQDAAIVHESRISVETMERWDVPLWATEYLANRNLALDIVHYELANSPVCRQIE